MRQPLDADPLVWIERLAATPEIVVDRREAISRALEIGPRRGLLRVETRPDGLMDEDVEASAPEVARQLVAAIGALDDPIPVLSCFMSARGMPDALRAPGVGIPSFRYPEQAAIALAHAVRYRSWRDRPEGKVPRFDDVRDDEATAVIAAALARGEGWMTGEEAERLLSCYGIASARTARSADDPEAAAQAAAAFDGRVVLKGSGPLHKTESGAVRVGLSAGDILDEARAMRQRVEAAGETLDGFTIQEQIEGGIEMLIGVVTDPVFGPVVACGGGGVTVELQRDVAIRVAPITDLDAEEMVRSLASFPLLDGFRGAVPADVPALLEAILRVSALADGHPEIAEMDCNPVMVLPRGVCVVDCRIRLQLPRGDVALANRATDG